MAGKQPLDWSMNLLRVVSESALDPAYAAHAGDQPTKGGRGLRVIIVTLAVALITIAAIQNFAAKPQNAQERDALIAQIEQAQAENDSAQAQVASLDADLRRLQAQALGTTSPQLANLEVAAGAVAVTGPGVVVTLDDSADGNSVVGDTDLSAAVNGLWQVGAEAIAINGHRISTRTAIRTAGSAITVNYVSLSAPYRVEAIGDPNTMPALFAATAAGRMWTFLKQNYNMGYTIEQASVLTLPLEAVSVPHASQATP